jgi:U3 small nucleolar ribonucleoprotein component
MMRLALLFTLLAHILHGAISSSKPSLKGFSERIMYADFFGGPPPHSRSRHGAGSSFRAGRNDGGRSGPRGRQGKGGGYVDEGEHEDDDGDEEDYDFDGHQDEKEQESDEEDEENEFESSGKGPEKAQTRYEKQRSERQKEIAAIEKKLVQQKSWDMRGEVNAKDRPENSLLEISAEMER